jgi:hypothetical protein
MYCPTCGSEERQLSQFCRSCGTDLRSVRNSLEKLDLVTASAVTARDRISVAIAEKIRELQSASDLHKVAEGVLPQIEKFLESPEERRLRRIRAGIVTAFIGVGTALGGLIASLNDGDLLVMMVPGALTFFIGIGVVVNGLAFTITRKKMPHELNSEMNALLDQTRSAGALNAPEFSEENNLRGPTRQPVASSVTEHTTKHLSNR